MQLMSKMPAKNVFQRKMDFYARTAVEIGNNHHNCLALKPSEVLNPSSNIQHTHLAYMHMLQVVAISWVHVGGTYSCWWDMSKWVGFGEMIPNPFYLGQIWCYEEDEMLFHLLSIFNSYSIMISGSLSLTFIQLLGQALNWIFLHW